MSSRAKTLADAAEKYGNYKKYTMYGSVVGSAVVTIGKLASKTEKELLKDFDNFSRDTNPLWDCKTIKEVCDYLIKFYDVKDEYKENIVLVYDEDNVYTPVVTLEVENNILPLDPNGMTLGILNHLDTATVEFIYKDEDKDCIEG